MYCEKRNYNLGNCHTELANIRSYTQHTTKLHGMVQLLLELLNLTGQNLAFLNQARACFLEVVFVKTSVCVCVCVSAPQALKTIHVKLAVHSIVKAV